MSSVHFIVIDASFRHPDRIDGEHTKSITPDKMIEKVTLIDSHYGIAMNVPSNKEYINDEKRLILANPDATWITKPYFLWKSLRDFSALDTIIYIVRTKEEKSVYELMVLVDDFSTQKRGYVSYTRSERIDLQEIIDDYREDRKIVRQVSDIYDAKPMLKEMADIDKKSYEEYIKIGIEFIHSCLRLNIHLYDHKQVRELNPSWDKNNPTPSWVFNVNTPFISGVIQRTNLAYIKDYFDQSAADLMYESSGFRFRLFKSVLVRIVKILVDRKTIDVKNVKHWYDLQLWESLL